MGTLAGTSEVSPGGQASYTIPLRVSPGVAGMTPSLALTYRSSDANGPFGVGFSLDGVAPPIRRCNDTIAQDGAAANYQFEVGDALCWGAAANFGFRLPWRGRGRV